MARLITFGGLSVQNGSVSNGAANPRSRLAILAVIAASGTAGIRREKLLALFWPESDEDRARTALRQALFAMRRDLGGADVVEGVADLRLNAPTLTADVTDFNAAIAAGRLEEAVELYRGPFLDGVFIRDSAPFEEWRDAERRRLGEVYARALDVLARRALAVDDAPAAVEWLRRAAAHDPFSGRVCRLYMEALARTGDRESAIRHSDVYARMVREGLEAEPDSAVLAYATELRQAPVASPSSAGQAIRPIASDDTARVFPPSAAVFSPRRPATRIAGAVLAALLILGAAALARREHANARMLVVVPPFAATSDDSSLTPFGALAADWVTQGVAETRLVDVADSRAVLARVKLANTNDLVTAVDATLIVRGSVSRVGDSVRVDASLVTRDGRVVADVPPAIGLAANPTIALEQIRQHVMGAFAAIRDERFRTWGAAIAHPPRYDAYREFLAGIEESAGGGPGAARHFLASAALDTSYVPAKIMAYNAIGDTPRGDSLLRAAEAMRPRLTPYETALLDRALAWQRDDWEGSYTASRHLLDLAPWSFDAKLAVAGDALGAMRYREAVRMYRSINHEPWVARWEYFWKGDVDALHNAQDYDGELADARQAFQLHPRSADICQLQIRPLAALGRVAQLDSVITQCSSLPGNVDNAYVRWVAGRELWAHDHRADATKHLTALLNDARAAEPPRPGVVVQSSLLLGDWTPMFEASAKRIAADPSDFVSLAQHGVAAAHMRDTATALAMLDAIEGVQARRHDGQRKLWEGFLVAALGRNQRALELIRQAVTAGISPTFFFHFNAPYIEPLRKEPEFQTLAKGRG